MFIDITSIDIQPKPIDTKNLSEIILSKSLRTAIQEMLFKEENNYVQVFEKTTIVQVDKQYVLFPNQWYYLAILCKKYAEALKPYCDFIDKQIRNQPEIQQEFLKENPYDSSLLKSLITDQADREKIIKFVNSDKTFRDGKALINKNKENGNAKIRATKDVFGSIVLKKLDVPDASSNYLGVLIYYLTKNPELYNSLEKEVNLQLDGSETSNIIKLPSSIKETAKTIVDIVYKIDKFNRIADLFEVTSSSIKINTYDFIPKGNWLRYMFALPSSGLYDSGATNEKTRVFEKEYLLTIKDSEYKCRLTTEWVGSDFTEDSSGGNYLLALIKLINKYYSEILKISNLSGNYCVHFFSNYNDESTNINTVFRQYITAIKTKPFLLLAGISGTGKSRIVRELARACWDEGTSEYKALKPSNFEMIQVKPNWHDSSELIGYLSNLNGTKFISGKFLEFVVKAWVHDDVPYFLCLDEMNLAPVEQYFAEYLSVIESRKYDENTKKIITDEIIKPVYENVINKDTKKLKLKEWYSKLIEELLADCPAGNKFDVLKTQFEDKGITIPQNLIVVGTVNMDETTFSFSRKVLDRAMTIEMNDIVLSRGLTEKHENIGKLGKQELIGDAVEASDVYSSNKEVCDKVLKYLEALNANLEGTPFKVAYRTRNEMMLYVVNNLPYNKDEDGKEILPEEIIAVALDEITNMKILSRIEGDETKVSNSLLNNLSNTIKTELNKISGKEYSGNKHNPPDSEIKKSVSMVKIAEMQERLKSGYTSFWN